MENRDEEMAFVISLLLPIPFVSSLASSPCPFQECRLIQEGGRRSSFPAMKRRATCSTEHLSIAFEEVDCRREKFELPVGEEDP